MRMGQLIYFSGVARIDMSGHTAFVRTSVQSAAATIQHCEGHAAPGGF